MRERTRSPFPRQALSAALLGALAVCSAPVGAAVTKATLTALTKTYHGDCPAKITFKGTVTVNAPGMVQYVFTRSDGATDTLTKTLKFRSAGSRSVSTTWTLGGPGLPHYQGWQAVKVLGPGGLESAHADFQVFCDPPANSAKAAHGNTDWHIDTANEFLFGRDMANNSTAANFAPATWTKTHIHVGQTNAARFYNDAARATAADDDDLGNGIDKPMLFFYAGHGNPTTWNALGDNAHQTGLLLGNTLGGGQLRYFWQCSCETFAHGPRVCSGGSCDYTEPQNFDGSADSANMRNVFERWGPAIGNDLRMACGVSSLAYCHEGNVNKIWDNFNNKGMSVAESFIDGLGGGSVKPLCITRGGPDITATPLYDQQFSNRHNASGNSWLHVMYAGGTDTDAPEIVWTPDRIPHKLFRVRLVKPGDPPEFRRKLSRIQRVEQLRDDLLAGGAALVRRDPKSGSVQLRSIRPLAPVVPRAALSDAQLKHNAIDFARRIGWVGEDLGVVKTKRILTASMPVGGAATDIRRGEKAVMVSIDRRIRNGDVTIGMLGDGGRIDVALGRDGRILKANRTWRTVVVGRDQLGIKPYAEAEREARRRVQHGADNYRIADWRFGYKEAAGNVEQGELPVVYEFDFVPVDRERLLDFPPQRVEVRAETG